jgi:hypothetical protein
MRLITIQKLVLITLLTLSATVFADDASKFYATIQAGLSKSISTGDMPIIDQGGLPGNGKSNDLGSGGVVGIGVGSVKACNLLTFCSSFFFLE